jgi:trans-aconitate 2-methyltransferase
MTDAWDPAQYARFRDERTAPFLDLIALVHAEPSMAVLDLGCGTAELSALLHQRLGARRTLGVDASENMLEQARAFAVAGVELRHARIEELEIAERFDLVLSNSVLHWVPEHPMVLARMTRWLGPGGQLAVQMPDNFRHVSQVVARELASQEPFASALGELKQPSVLAPEQYAELLAELGYARQAVRLQVYGHTLARAEDVVEWVKGSVLTPYRARLAVPMYEHFLEAYRDTLFSRWRVLETGAIFFTYRRLLLWARLPGGEARGDRPEIC